MKPGASFTRTVTRPMKSQKASAAFNVSWLVLSLVLFRKTDPTKLMTPQKKKRNKVYAVCGVLILVAIAGSGISFLFRDSAFFELYAPVFWFESLAVVSFGVSWLTKGEAILTDH